VPLMGGTIKRLNGDLIGGGRVSRVQISSDSSRVVYRADQATNNVDELWSVPIAGGDAVRLNTDLPVGGDVTSFQIAPDNSRVVYIADAFLDDVFRLHSVPLTGGEITNIALGAPPNGPQPYDVEYLRISPNSSRVVYLADRETTGVFDLWSVPIGGGESVRLNGALPVGGEVDVGSIGFSPDSSRVFYIADVIFADVYRLFSVPITGGISTNLAGNIGAAVDVSDYRISPDGSRVVYYADRTTNEVYELWSVPVAGGTSVRVSDDLVANGDVNSFQISPDNRHVVYLADQEEANKRELYHVPLGGGESTRFNASLVVNGDVEEFAISPDSGTVVYCADQEANDAFSVYATSDAPPSVTVSGPKGALGVGDHTLNVTLSNAKLLGSAAVSLGKGLSNAVSGQDYQLEGGNTVQFAPGQISKQITLTVLSNAQRTTARTLTLSLANPSGATLGEPKSVVLTLAPSGPTVGPTTPTTTATTTTGPTTPTGPTTTTTATTTTGPTDPAGPTVGPVGDGQRVYLPLVSR
jgi:dipeptidyl aminopeptidase/acylaminoacyl peptidase